LANQPIWNFSASTHAKTVCLLLIYYKKKQVDCSVVSWDKNVFCCSVTCEWSFEKKCCCQEGTWVRADATSLIGSVPIHSPMHFIYCCWYTIIISRAWIDWVIVRVSLDAKKKQNLLGASVEGDLMSHTHNAETRA